MKLKLTMIIMKRQEPTHASKNTASIGQLTYKLLVTRAMATARYRKGYNNKQSDDDNAHEGVPVALWL